MCFLVHCSAYLGVCSHFASSFLENHINCIQLGAVAKRWQLTVLPAVFLGQFRREIKVRVYAFLASNTLSHTHTRTHFGHAYSQVGWRGCGRRSEAHEIVAHYVFMSISGSLFVVWVPLYVWVCVCVWHAAMTCKTFLGLQSPQHRDPPGQHLMTLAYPLRGRI